MSGIKDFGSAESTGIAELTDSKLNPSDSDDSDELVLKLMNVEYVDTERGPVVHLFGREQDGSYHHVEVDGHRPSFFARPEEVTSRLENHYAVAETRPAERTTLHGEPLTRIFTTTSEAVGDVRELFDETFEADVFFDKRWLIDRGVEVGCRIDTSAAITDEPWLRGEMRVDTGSVEGVSEAETPRVEPRKLVFDIEVGSTAGVPDADEAEWPVTTIVGRDSDDEQYVGWFLRHDDHELPSHDEMVDDSNLDSLRVFADESAMLSDFNGFVESARPDILTGWYSNDFDVPYLIQRCKNLNTYSYQDWSPLGDVWVGNFGPTVVGVSAIDSLEAYQKTQIHELDDKSLDGVATDELGSQKVALGDDGELSHTEMWKQNPVEFLRYNKVDVELVVDIDETVGVFEMLDNIRYVAGCSYDDPVGGNFDVMDLLFLRKADAYGYALPTAEKPDVEDLHGGYVIQPQAGVHEHVVYPDYSSLYPNMMYQCNISPETLVGTADDLADSGLTEDDCVWSYVDTETPPPQKSEVEPDLGIEAESPKSGDSSDESADFDFQNPAEGDVEKMYFEKPSRNEGFVRAVLDDIMGMCDRYEGDMYEASKRVRNSCVTPETDVLTADGVRNITDIEVGDEVYSWNPESEQMELKPVLDTIERDHDGDIYHVNTNGIDVRVTGDHDMLVKRHRHSDEWERTEMASLNEWTDYQMPHDWSAPDGDERDVVDITRFLDDYEIRVEPSCHGRTFAAATDWTAEPNENGAYYLSPDDFAAHEDAVRAHADTISVQMGRQQSSVPMEYDADNFIKLLGWYVTEGSISHIERKSYGDVVRGESTIIHISQHDSSPHKGDIESLLDEMRLSYSVDDRSFSVTGATPIAEALEQMCGRGAAEKSLPRWVFDTSARQRQLLFETLMAGDGDAESPRYTTKSERLRDDVRELLVHLGETPRVSADSGVYRVTWNPDATNSFRVEGSVETEQYDGKVHCLTVADNHTFVAGRNGNLSVIGNCYGFLGDSDTYGKGSRMYDWRMAEATTLGGQRVLRGGAEKFEEVAGDDAEIVGGDTDSTMASFDVDDRETALAEAGDVVSDVNEWLDGFTKEQFGLDDESDARMELELESYAATLFFKGEDDGQSDDGVKKRYAQLIEWDDDQPDPCDEHVDGGVTTWLRCDDCAINWIDDPEPEISGFEYVRSDVAPITKEVQYRTFEELLTRTDEAESTIKDYVTDLVTRVMERDEDFDRSRLGIRFGISQQLSEYGSPDQTPQPQYRGAKFANAEIYGGDAIEEGDKPMYFYVHEGKTGSLRKTYDATTREDGRYVDAISVLDGDDLPDGIEIDREKMLEKTVVDPMEGIFRTLGWVGGSRSEAGNGTDASQDGIDWLTDAIEDAKPPESYRDDGQMGFESFEKDSQSGGGGGATFNAATFM
jgi:DNA polymerase I